MTPPIARSSTGSFAATGRSARHGRGQSDVVSCLVQSIASHGGARKRRHARRPLPLVDRYHLDALTGRFEAERTVIRSGRVRRVNFVKRLFGFPELRDWLHAAGFAAVAGYGEDGRPLTAEHKRMIIVANLP
jgi:hypothetical protein